MFVVTGGFALAAVAVVGLAAHDFLAAKRHLDAGAGGLRSLAVQPEQLIDAKRRVIAERQATRSIAQIEVGRRTMASSVPIKLVSLLPGLRYQRAETLQLVTDARDAATAGRNLLLIGDTLAGTDMSASTVPLDTLAKAQAQMQQTARELRRVTRGERGLWGPLGTQRRDLEKVTGPLAVRLQTSADTVGALRGFLGADGPRRYMVGGANNAEMRDQGAILSFAIITFDGGKLTIERTDPIASVQLAHPAPVVVPEGTQAVFGPLLPNQVWQSINATADVGFTGRAAQVMWQQKAGEHLDGLVVVDAPALASVIGAVGAVPAQAGAPRLTEANAVEYLLSGQYAGVPAGPAGQQQRQESIASVAKAVATRALGGGYDPGTLAKALATSAAGRHLVLWSDVPAEQRQFVAAGLGGGPGDDPKTASSTFHVAVEEAGATKLDYYVRPSVKVAVHVTKAGTAIVRTTVHIDNRAPVGGAPSYVLGPNTGATQKPGQYVARVYLWAPKGSEVPDSVDESGLRLAAVKPILVEPGTTGDLSFDTVIEHAVQGGAVHLRFVPQPRHVPMPLILDIDAEGWTVHGPRHVETSLSRSIPATWAVTR